MIWPTGSSAEAQTRRSQSNCGLGPGQSWALTSQGRVDLREGQEHWATPSCWAPEPYLSLCPMSSLEHHIPSFLSK